MLKKLLGLVFTRKVARALDSVARTPEAVTAIKKTVEAFRIENTVAREVDAEVVELENDTHKAEEEIVVNEETISSLRNTNVDLNDQIVVNKNRFKAAIEERTKWA